MSTAVEVMLKQRHGQLRLDRIRLKMESAWQHAMREALTGPRRRRWDQYGAYHRRMMKKWLKRRRAFGAVSKALVTALATPDVKWFGLDLAAPGGDRTLYYGGGTGGGKTWRGETL